MTILIYGVNRNMQTQAPRQQTRTTNTAAPTGEELVAEKLVAIFEHHVMMRVTEKPRGKLNKFLRVTAG